MDQKAVGGCIAGLAVIIVDGVIQNGDAVIQHIQILAFFAAQVVDVPGFAVLDHQVGDDGKAVMLFLQLHLHRGHGFRESKIVQLNSLGKRAGKPFTHPGFNVHIFQNVIQRISGAEQRQQSGAITAGHKRTQFCQGIFLLGVQSGRLGRIEFSGQQFGVVNGHHIEIAVEDVPDLVTKQAAQTQVFELARRETGSQSVGGVDFDGAIVGGSGLAFRRFIPVRQDPAFATVPSGSNFCQITEHCCVQPGTEQFRIGDGQFGVLDASAHFQMFVSHSLFFPPSGSSAKSCSILV